MRRRALALGLFAAATVPVLLTMAIAHGRAGEPAAVVIPSGFRWRNDGYLDPREHMAIRSNGLQRVYFKLLDIGWNPANGAHPLVSVEVPYQWARPRWPGDRGGVWRDSVEFVPCIYITNNTFERIDDRETGELAANLLKKLRLSCPDRIHGVMLDCDWTAGTRERFFQLVRVMNDSLSVPVTATIRLHQYAHPAKTGVPPADRGMLMVYNVGRLQDHGDANSIFDRETAAAYFNDATPYPLPLDLALPAFSWGAHFHKGRFKGILHDDQVSTAEGVGLLSPDREGLRQVLAERNDLAPGLHLGDELRIERMTPEAIAQAVGLARKAVHSDTVAVAFFEVGARCFQELDTAFTASMFRSFGKPRSPWGQAAPPGSPAHGSRQATVDSVAAEPATTPKKP